MAVCFQGPVRAKTACPLPLGPWFLEAGSSEGSGKHEGMPTTGSVEAAVLFCYRGHSLSVLFCHLQASVAESACTSGVTELEPFSVAYSEDGYFLRISGT